MLELKRIYWTRKSLRLGTLCTVAWLFAGAVFAAATHASMSQRPTSFIDVLGPILNAALAAVALPGAIFIVLVGVAVVIRANDVRRRDPLRRFTRQQRREGMARADGQCELEAGLHRRCLRPAEHGDHFYPWSKGGTTSLQNFVAACSRCNHAKGARIPSPGQQKRLEQRRLAYISTNDAIRVGERRELTGVFKNLT
ncbi:MULTISPECIES: HNH endonuclease [Arthrobacter]|uniref:HNH endonuclease n=1 Tax=Arthrobacter terricola TaxID=2547396 RepID=A0A4R5KIG8_9MICC|nr:MULTISPECIES: HNH endonuclease [Arthrobacter]MBT8161648.1 HNH endonuclease [Arthrobacter sp. GN70]TDF95309.1 HNH endonuclease [Arthrobacter terricola]